MKDSYEQYYTGGLAEIVNQPSPVTFEYLQKWFTGKGSLGKAMNLLGLPYEQVDISALDILDGELVVNLHNEEQILYQGTVFTYKKQGSVDLKPQLVVAWKKLIKPQKMVNTMRILWRQSQWISRPNYFVKQAGMWVNELQFELEILDKKEIVQLIEANVFPRIIAIGMLAEFYEQYLKHELREDYESVSMYISSQVKEKDWLFKSLVEQFMVRQGEMSLDKYLQVYGKRADQDYELTEPRWYEIPDVIKKRIEHVEVLDTDREMDFDYARLNGHKRILIEAVIGLHIMRSEARRNALPLFDRLRQMLIQEGTINKKRDLLQKVKQNTNVLGKKEGQGIAVSSGQVKGRIKVITKEDLQLDSNIIGVFANASPEFSWLYPQCLGIIFLRGGQTSHGAIVAREYGIPALIDSEVNEVGNGVWVEMDGGMGSWKVVADEAGKVDVISENNTIDKRNSERQIISNSVEDHRVYSNSVVSRKDKPLEEFSKNTDQEDKKIIRPYIIKLQEVGRYDAEWVGGKAANLGELMRIGMPVPKGFVVTTRAFREFKGEKGIGSLEKDVLASVDALKLEKVAVRSSVVGEDSKTASWAGQFESHLYVKRDDIISRIQDCWRSINTARVEEYALRQGMDVSELEVAVVVQEMVVSEVSGVMFTTEPITQMSNKMVIEAVQGLGEVLAQGEIVPERFVIDRNTLEVLEGGDKGYLEHDELRELAQMGLKIEQHFGSSQDIEWAKARKMFYILQTRPLVT